MNNLESLKKGWVALPVYEEKTWSHFVFIVDLRIAWRELPEHIYSALPLNRRFKIL